MARSRSRLGAAAAALAAVALAAGCTLGTAEADFERLRAAGIELAGPEATVVDTSEGACVQLEGNPNCVRVYFVVDLPERERVDAFLAAARQDGWEIVFRNRLRDGTWIQLRREGLRAFAAMWNDDRLAPCLEQPELDCSDELQVSEDRG